LTPVTCEGSNQLPTDANLGRQSHGSHIVVARPSATTEKSQVPDERPLPGILLKDYLDSFDRVN
jgi:hypothetical protein